MSLLERESKLNLQSPKSCFFFSSFSLQWLYASGRMLFLKWIWSCHSSQKQPSWLLVTPRKMQPPWDGTQQVYFPTWPASSTSFLSPMPHLPVTSHDGNFLALRLCSGSCLCLRGLPLYCNRSSTFRPSSYIKAFWTLQVIWATLFSLRTGAWWSSLCGTY